MEHWREKYITDFTYQVIGVNEYTNEELREKHDEMSLVMLINKIQTPEDLNEFRNLSVALLDSVYGSAPEEIKEIYRKIIEYNYRNNEKDKNKIIDGRQKIEKDRQFKQNYRIIK